MDQTLEHHSDRLQTLHDLSREISQKKGRLHQIQKTLQETLVGKLGVASPNEDAAILEAADTDHRQYDMTQLRDHAHHLQENMETISVFIQSLNELRAEIRELMHTVDGVANDFPHA